MESNGWVGCLPGGKSAILTALCVAFGIKAKGTQRANSVKDFIKNGCRFFLPSPGSVAVVPILLDVVGSVFGEGRKLEAD